MAAQQLKLFFSRDERQKPLTIDEFIADVKNFNDFGKKTQAMEFPLEDFSFPVYVNEFWTSRQRTAHSLHEISYRACFKPQLPRFFIRRLTKPDDLIYDPFAGRGTTVIEAALMGRRPSGCDINPLSRILTRPRLNPPTFREVEKRLGEIDLKEPGEIREDLLVFYHPLTLRQIMSLKNYLMSRQSEGTLDHADDWIRMVATNRLTGHSPGFFSVYTLPPNQAVAIGSQKKLNEKRDQSPPVRDVTELILRKTKSLFADLKGHEAKVLRKAARHCLLLTGSSDNTPGIKDESVALSVTSPPFLDTVDYQADNWLRCWFNGIDAGEIDIWQLKDPARWQAMMTATFKELQRVLVPGGYAAFEVGEVRGGKIQLETLVAPAAREAGLIPIMLMVNDQVFTKTSNCWGVENLKKGTNSNRIILLRKQ